MLGVKRGAAASAGAQQSPFCGHWSTGALMQSWQVVAAMAASPSWRVTLAVVLPSEPVSELNVTPIPAAGWAGAAACECWCCRLPPLLLCSGDHVGWYGCVLLAHCCCGPHHLEMDSARKWHYGCWAPLQHWFLSQQLQNGSCLFCGRQLQQLFAWSSRV
jgi:hypothetical protein